MQGVYVIQHLFRVRVAGRVKFVAAPLVVFPVLPVLDNVVDGNRPPAHFREGFHQFVLRGVPFPALPEAEGPLGEERSFAREGTIVADDLVIASAGQVVEIFHGLEF